MMTPGHQEQIGLKTDPIEFSGAVTQPNKRVVIQAKDRSPGTGWNYIGEAYSGSFPVYYSGTNWYLWNADLVVPHAYWSLPELSDGLEWYAEVRAIDGDTGQPLFTWEEGFYEYFDLSKPMGDQFQQHGHGQSVTIWGYVPLP
jgi:hypothetical protein